MNQSQRMMVRTHGTMLGRMLMGFLFFYSGIGILANGVSETAMYFSSTGMPLAALMVWVVLAIKLGAGGALIVGYRAGSAAALLVLFTLGTVFAVHLGDGLGAENMGLWKNLAIIGGLLYVMTYGPGDGWSIEK